MIRPAKSDDAAAIRRVAEGAYRPYVRALGKPPAPMVADFERHIDQDRVIVLERDGCISGYAIMIADDRRALLDNIAVDPACQGAGVGRALVGEVERQVTALGYKFLELYTNVVMTANVAWYQKLGFVETERIREHGFHRVYMRKALASD